MKFSPSNAQHIGSRSEQQDSFGFSDPSQSSFVEHGGIVAVVADGMGGLAHGSDASQTAVSGFLRAYEAKSPDEPIPDALLRSIRVANDAVTALARAADARNGLGTTLAAAVLHKESLYWISAGDSRVYFHRDGNLTCLTTDHIYAADLSEQVTKGEITQAAAMTHPERASLTSYLGLDNLPKVEHSRRPFPVESGDSVLICSDGLYRALSDDEIAAGLKNDAPHVCELLVDRALAKALPAQDNMTVLALKCRREPQTLFGGKGGFKRLGVLIGLCLFFLVAASGAIWWRFRQNLPTSSTAPKMNTASTRGPGVGVESKTQSGQNRATPNTQTVSPPVQVRKTAQSSIHPTQARQVTASKPARSIQSSQSKLPKPSPPAAAYETSTSASTVLNEQPPNVEFNSEVASSESQEQKLKLTWSISKVSNAGCNLAIVSGESTVFTQQLSVSSQGEGFLLQPVGGEYRLLIDCNGKKVFDAPPVSR